MRVLRYIWHIVSYFCHLGLFQATFYLLLFELYMEYNFQRIEQQWKQYWQDNKVYKIDNTEAYSNGKPKCYVLDMFPYPSGAGLHVGHPLGYIASDIYARYKRLCGYNVLHPMGFDAFGLPAEQYAIETGQHPAVTTEKNIARYHEQLDNIGFCYDWDREVRTSEPKYYKWTQWIFLQLFHSYYDHKENKAKHIDELIAAFQKEGNASHACPAEEGLQFDAAAWANFSEEEQRNTLMKYRLAYQGYAQVWWCEALGTVLANDEVVNGVSERGGHPVERKNMRQWFLRITEYADRLLTSLDTLDWSESMKEMQRNWIGKSVGAEVYFSIIVKDIKATIGNNDFKSGELKISIPAFTTRPDTIFGVDFIVLAPEHNYVDLITTKEQFESITHYKHYVKSRSERERMSEVKQVTGCFTGAYAIHPLSQKEIPVWISEYVLVGYGTGAIMAVPSGDDRDHAFAKHFNIPVTNVFGEKYNGEKAYSNKSGTIENSSFLSGMTIKDAAAAAIEALEDEDAGKKKVNFRLRDAGFSRQRYWGEPFPIMYVDDTPYAIDEHVISNDTHLGHLPVELPMVEHYKPGPEGQGPLANIEDWVTTSAGQRETNTMPGYAGSSWYFLRYMDPHNDATFADKKATDYWQQVDLYIGGTEHAVGHLLYSRMWTKVLYDLGHISFDEPFKKLLNQGMIQGSSRFVYRFEILDNEFKNREELADFVSTMEPSQKSTVFISEKIKEEIDSLGSDKIRCNKFLEKYASIIPNALDIINSKATPTFIQFKTRIETRCVDGVELDVDCLRNWRPDYINATFIMNDGSIDSPSLKSSTGKYICGTEVEKMSKSKYNVVNPDVIVKEYGADTFRMYEMFLGPIDISKPWDTKGIEGVHRFLKKLWRLYFDEQRGRIFTDEKATDAELKILHKTIKKISENIERFSFNTSVSQFMICVNELTTLNCHKREILEPLAVIICPFAPHLAEELWHQLGHSDTVVAATFPKHDDKYIIENAKKYPVAVNGKPKVEMEFMLDADPADIEKEVLADATIMKWTEGNPPKKFIYVKGKMINVVI